MNSDNTTLRILRTIGSPVGPIAGVCANPGTVESDYKVAYENRVGYLYLNSLPAQALTDDMAEALRAARTREQRTNEIAAGIAQTLQKGGYRHVIFKSFRPFPYNPNDTDVLVLEPRSRFQEVTQFLLDSGYPLLGVAPLQSLFYDPSGKGKVTNKKRGGTYYIDLYKAAGSDYFIYLDSNYAARHVRMFEVAGVQCPILEPELELSVMLYHNIFPENTFHLEHFYLALCYLYGQRPFSIERFVMHTRKNRYTVPVRANLSVAVALHQHAFGNVPDNLRDLLKEFGSNERESASVVKAGFRTPHYFHSSTFLGTIATRALNSVSMRSLCIQAVHMLNPSFGLGAWRSLTKRLKGVGVYEQM